MGVILQSTIPLAANAQWSTSSNNLRTGGQGNSSRDGSTVNVCGKADQAGLCRIEESDDGTNFRVTGLTNVQPGVYFSFQVGVNRDYWQAVFQNGPVAQATFSISVDATDSPLLAILHELRKLNMSVLAMQDRRPIAQDSLESLIRM